jgi:hypothetical protein
VIPVQITGGDGESEDRGVYRVPKRDLIVGLQVVEKRCRLADRAPTRIFGARDGRLIRSQSTTATAGFS